MQVVGKYINIACPSCGSEKIVNIPLSLFTEKKFGHVKIQVPQGAVCPDHVFVVLLDLEARILGYQTVDLSVSSADESTPKDQNHVEKDESLGLMRFIRMLGYNCFAGLIHAKLFDYQPYIIKTSTTEIDMNEVNQFLDDIVPEVYKNHKFVEEIEYDDETFPTATYFYALVKNQKTRDFLMNPHKQIIQIPWQTGLELEKTIIANTLNNKNPNEHLKFVSFYISKFLEDVDKTKKIIDPVKKISNKDIVKKLKEIAITSTISKEYVSSIKEFIHRRISPDLASKIRD
ncbi:MAG: hypothetical protein ACFE9C_01930 [Candidatus Hodarchaeota archaeon]